MGRYGRGQGRRRGRFRAGGRVEFAGARRVHLTCECSSMSCMEHGGYFSLRGSFAYSLISVGSTLNVSRFSVS